MAAQREELYSGDPQVVLDTLRALRDELRAQTSAGLPPPALEVVSDSFDYLDKRKDQIRYADFRAQG